MKKIKAASLFSSSGIAELLLDDVNIEVVVANEILEKRSAAYKVLHPKSEMIQGDIRCDSVKQIILSKINTDVKLLIATPPCQGLSTLGKNKKQEHYVEDSRNYLIFDVFEIIDKSNFDYILIENVPKFLNMHFPYENELLDLMGILEAKYSEEYVIDSRVLNAKDLGVPQSRPRAIIKLFKKGLKWEWPKPEMEITLKDAIGYLPPLEPGEKSNIKWHYAKVHKETIVDALRHTPTGKSAMKNEVYFPKKDNGEKIKGFHNTYKRMSWDMPCHARTTYSGSPSSHNNIHPGRKLNDGLYSDPRVLTLLETFIVSTIPEKIDFPEWASDTFIRTLIGEAIPPLMLNKVLMGIER
jgi:DNA (cytosine-5)-methyltransferase 1